MNMKTNTQDERKFAAQARNEKGGRRKACGRSQRGASLVELAFMMPLLSLLVVGVVDMGRAFYLSMEVSDAARAGAMYGYETSSTMQDTSGIQTAASNDAPDVTGLTTTSSYGCMCSNGTNQSTNCSSPPTCTSGSRQVNYVIVNTSATYTTLFPWPKVPSSFALTGTAQLVAGQ
jgi:Flp pilus assembly protein TadG